MDIGIAKFYLKQYDDAVSFKIESRLNPRNYLLELEFHENDSSVRRDVEYNVYEALHQKYRSLPMSKRKPVSTGFVLFSPQRAIVSMKTPTSTPT